MGWTNYSRSFLSIFLVTISLCCADDPFDRVLQLSRIRHKMADSINRMPDYTCLATNTRASRGRKDKHFKAVDTLRFEIAHVGATELWAWPGAKRFQDTPLTSMIQNGAISLGDFALYARTVFVEANGRLKFQGPEQLDGRATLRWNYEIPAFLSGWQIGFGHHSAVAAAAGSFWADPETLDILRLEIRTADLPFDFPLTEVVNTIDYARTRIGETLVQLPQSAVLMLRRNTGELQRNSTEFSHCKQFSGEAAISFEPKAEAGSIVESAKKTEEVSLSSGLRLRLKLGSSIDSANSVVGELVEGTLENDVSRSGFLLVPKGAHITGRIRRMEKHAEGPYYIVGIELDDVDYPGHHARFFGSLLELDPQPPGFQWFLGSERTEEGGRFKNGGGMTTVTVQKGLQLGNAPGVGTFFMLGPAFRISKGTVMVWDSQSL